MALGKNCGLGLIRRTSSFGRKRISILNDYSISKKQCFKCDSVFMLEDLPQHILIRILCGVEHDDLKTLFHVSKPIREAALIAKKLHFEYNTPKKIPAFRYQQEELSSSEFDEMEAPNGPKQWRVPRSRLTEKTLAYLSVDLFDSSMNEDKEDNREKLIY